MCAVGNRCLRVAKLPRYSQCLSVCLSVYMCLCYSVIGVGAQSTLGRDIFAQKICTKNYQNARIFIYAPKLTKSRIVHDNFPKHIFPDLFVKVSRHVPHLSSPPFPIPSLRLLRSLVCWMSVCDCIFVSLSVCIMRMQLINDYKVQANHNISQGKQIVHVHHHPQHPHQSLVMRPSCLLFGVVPDLAVELCTHAARAAAADTAILAQWSLHIHTNIHTYIYHYHQHRGRGTLHQPSWKWWFVFS